MHKKLKTGGRKTLKKHYLILVLVCLVGAFLGSEFSSSLTVTKIENNINIEEKTIASKIKKENIKQIEKEEKAKIDNYHPHENKFLGRQRGVLASVINTLGSGKFIFTVFTSLTTLGNSPSLAIALLVILSLIISFIFWYFFTNTYVVINRRIFLESRLYEKIPAHRFLFLKRVNKWFKASLTMLILSIYKVLWNLTIIGGVIKHYSYILVPYILSENPSIKADDAINLSKDMMKGHKWECFKLELSFIGWYFLGIITFGLSNIFYLNSYKVATLSEYYAQLRLNAKKENIKNANKLNDEYLYQKASSTTLKKEYSDVINAHKKEINVELKGVSGFLIKNLGISILNKKDKELYDQKQINSYKVNIYQDVYAGKAYPERLSPVKYEEKHLQLDHTNYLKSYTIPNLILLFFIISFIGWLWEVSLHLIRNGVFVNRGALHGPWLPIYGYGGILILIFLNRFRKKPLIEFVSAITLCGIVEYFTSYFLELTHNGMRWWDYSGYFINLNGRICAEGLLVFGLGGICIVYLLAPLIDNLLNKLNGRKLIALAACLLLIFGADQVYSFKHPNTGKGISSARK